MSDADRNHFDRRSILRVGALAGLAFATSTPSRRALADTPARIGVIGAGHIGSTIGSLWVKSGHPVMFSSRHPEELAPMVQGLGALAKAGTVGEAIDFGDVVFIAVPYMAYPQIGKDYGSKLSGKVVLDAGNATERRDGSEMAAEAKEQGIGVMSAKYLPGARIVR